ncbi:MAG: hypothetical protein GXP29_00375, partial [Planctomycetes bacterium]|nr:hypothetical protein [Planctomycetota bacterium]
GSSATAQSSPPPAPTNISSNGAPLIKDINTNGTVSETVDVSTTGLVTDATDSEPEPPGPLDFQPPSQSGLEQGWASIDEHADPMQRACLEGTVNRSDKIVIDTNNVRRFTLELPHLHVNWKKRIALRIDGSTSELTRKRWPRITLERTPSGAWVVVK